MLKTNRSGWPIVRKSGLIASISGFSIVLSSTFAYAVPAVFFDADTTAGLNNFNQTIANADAAWNAANPGSTPRTTTIYEFNFDTENAVRGHFATTTATTTYTVTATSTSTHTTATVASPATVYFTVTAPGGTGVRTEAGNDYAAWSVSGASWADHVNNGYIVEFFSDAGRTTPVGFNAISIMTDDWGTCCTGGNDTPTGTANGSAIYYQFLDGATTDTLLVGNITSSVSSTDHFTAAINDSQLFSNIRLIPNGDGEAFGAGGILRFASVAINSVPAGSSVVVGASTSTGRDITLASDVYTGLGTATTYAFDGGTLSVGADLSDNFSIKAGGGSVSVANGSTFTMSGVLSNDGSATGAFSKVGPGTLVLTGTNTYTGGTTVTAGTLRGAVGSLQGNIVNNATVEFAQGSDATFASVVSGSGAVTKTEAGVLTLTGTNTYTGGTTVTAGTLQLNGTLTSDISVGSVATLSGVGLTTGNLTSSGSVAPGNSPGTLTVAGDVVFTSTNSFDLDIDGRTYIASGGAGTYDRLVITGASSTFAAGGIIAPIVRGITAPANNTFTPVIGDTFRVVTTANASGVSGAFSTVTQPATGLSANTRFDVLYGANYVDLVLTAADLGLYATNGGGNQNTVRAATALQGVRPAAGAALTGDAGAYWIGLYGLDGTQTLLALEQTAGQIHAYALSELRASNVALARFDPAVTLRASADQALWVMFGADASNAQADRIASGYDSNGRDVWIGADLENTGARRYGLALGYSDRDITTNGMGSANADTRSVMAYYFGETGSWDYSGLISFGFTDLDTQRSVTLATGTLSNASDSTARSQVAKLQLGYTEALSEELNARFSADLSRLHTEASGFTETGSATTALTAATERQTETRINLGAGVTWTPTDLANSLIYANAGVELSEGQNRVSNRDVTLHGSSWEVEVPYITPRMGFVEMGIRTTLGDLMDGEMADADLYHINGNIRYARNGGFENTSIVVGIAREF